MRHLVYSVRYYVVLINCLLFTVTLYSSVRTVFVYNDKQYPFPDVINDFDYKIRDVSMVFPLRLTTDFTATDT